MTQIVKAIRTWWNKIIEKGYSTDNVKRITRHNGWLLLLAWPFLTVIALAKAMEAQGYMVLVAFGFSVLWITVALCAIRWGRR